MNCPWIFFLILQGSGVCRGQVSLAHPGCRQPLGSQCSGIPLVPSHLALLSAFSRPPSCVLEPGLISGVEMGPGKSKRSVWEAGPCLLVPILSGATHRAFFRNTWEFPVYPTSSGPPVHRPHGAETQHWLCKSDTFIFSLKVHYQTAASYGGAGLSLRHYGTTQPSFTTPSPVPSSLSALSLPWPALGACLVTPLSP